PASLDEPFHRVLKFKASISRLRPFRFACRLSKGQESSMSRQGGEGRWTLGVGALLGLAVAIAPARAGEDPRTVARFLPQLRNRGLHDLALEYVTGLRGDATLPNDLKVILDYEEGRTLIDEAAKSSDLVLREQLLQEARTKLEGFSKAHAQRPEAREALVQL